MLKHKNKLFLMAVIGFSILFMPSLVSAQSATSVPVVCPDGFSTTVGSADAAERQAAAICADHQVGDAAADSGTQAQSLQGDCKVALSEVNNTDSNPDNDCGIVKYLVIFINVLSALVGIVVVIMITIGGIQYSASRDNPQATAAAKQRILNAILALVAFLFMFAFLQWLVPGGIF
jgi:hypothetical protein